MLSFADCDNPRMSDPLREIKDNEKDAEPEVQYCHLIHTDKEYNNVLDIVQKFKKRYKVKWEEYTESWEPEENVKHLLAFSWTFNSKKRKKTGKK